MLLISTVLLTILINKLSISFGTIQPQVSGSAAKLSKDVSYHHFTILIDVDQENLKGLLKPDENVSRFL